MKIKAAINNRAQSALDQLAVHFRTGEGDVTVSSAWTQLTDYLAWQQGQERAQDLIRTEHAETVIRNGDPECEAVIAALEEGWMRHR